MAASPKYKCFNADGEYVASVKERELAAAIMAFIGDGGTVRIGHSKSTTIYTEGADGVASESYDTAAECMANRERELQTAWHNRN